MKALCWYGPADVRLETVPDPSIEAPTDAIVQITSTAICGSDLHLYNGHMPAMQPGDVIGHEAMGIVVETGKAVTKLKKGDRVVVPFTIACGHCFHCGREQYSLCDRSNRNAAMQRKAVGTSTAGLFGFSHLTGGYAGSQAELVRVPFADVGPLVVPNDLPDEKLLFLSDILATGWMAAENAQIEPGETVAVWGCGPVGQLAIHAARMLGAERVIAIDRVPERLSMTGAETIHFEESRVLERLSDLTNGLGPDRCIDAVGGEAHFRGSAETPRPHVLREAILACRKGGTISAAGIYLGSLDKVPFGAAMNKALTIKTGQTHVQKYTRPLLQKIVDGTLDPTFVITHRMPLDEAPRAYAMFNEKRDGCVKVVLTP